MQNSLFILHGRYGVELEPPRVFLSHKEAYKEMKGRYKDALNESDKDDYDEDSTCLGASQFTIAFHDDWFEMQIVEVPHPGIRVPLPDGRMLHADDKCDPNYPGIQIHEVTKKKSGKEVLDIIAWVEYNTGRADYTDEQRLRGLLWTKKKNDPVANISYDTGHKEKEE